MAPSRMLWITSEQPGFQPDERSAWPRPSPRKGFAAGEGLPAAGRPRAPRTSSACAQALDRGRPARPLRRATAGRFIWRTGPADWQQHRDLFNLDDIDKLNTSGRLPVVREHDLLLGALRPPERRLHRREVPARAGQGRGGGASPRRGATRPYRAVSDGRLSRELTRPGAPRRRREADPEGEAAGTPPGVHRAVQPAGDPALRAGGAAPAAGSHGQPGAWRAADGHGAALDTEAFKGQAQLDWLDAKGQVVQSQEIAVDGPRFPRQQAPGRRRT